MINMNKIAAVAILYPHRMAVCSDDLTVELGALLNKIAADAKAGSGPPPSFGTAYGSDGPGPSPSIIITEEGPAALAGQASASEAANGRQREHRLSITSVPPSTISDAGVIEGGALQAVDPLEGTPGALVSSVLVPPPDDSTFSQRPVSRRGRASKDGPGGEGLGPPPLTPEHPVLSQLPQPLATAAPLTAPAMSENQPGMPVPSPASLAAAAAVGQGKKGGSPNSGRAAAADAEATVVIKGSPPVKASKQEPEAVSSAPTNGEPLQPCMHFLASAWF